MSDDFKNKIVANDMQSATTMEQDTGIYSLPAAKNVFHQN